MQQRNSCRNVYGTSVALAGIMLFSTSGRAQTGATTAMPDAQIEANVLKTLAGSPKLANENIISNTVYGTVTLSGTVPDEPTRQMAENLASRADGVKKVIDELTLGAPGAPAQANGDGLPHPNGAPPQSFGGAPQTSGEHAPDPDTYAAQHGYNATGQSNPDDTAANTQPPYRQPYNQGGYGQQPQVQQPQVQQPQTQQPMPGYGSQQRGPQGYQGQRNAPPPYGSQVAGQPVTVPAGSLLRIRINEGLDSKHTQPGTQFDAVVLNDVVADGAVAIPRGASVQGIVVDSKSGGVIKGHGELTLKLNQVTLGGKTFPIVSDIWTRDSSDKSGQTIGSAVGMGAFGALIGAVAGGGPGAAIGAGAGAAAGIGSSAASGSRQIMVPAEAILTFHLTQPTPMTTISQAEMDRLSYGVPAGGAQAQMRRRPPPPAYYGPGYYPPPPPPYQY
jgi:hypothetical protein